MDVRQLRYFVVLSEELHFGRAAAKLHIAQPALSQQIKTVEAELGLVLLERTSRGVTLTDAGGRFLAEARAVVSRFDAALETMRRLRDGELGRLRIGVFPGPLGKLLPPLLAELRREQPGVEVETRFIPTEAQVEALLAARLDLAFLPSLGQLVIPPPLAQVEVSREPLGIAIPAAHPLAAAATLRAAEVAQMPLVFMARNEAPRVYDAVLGALAATGARPRSILESSTPDASLSIVAAGLAASVKTEGEVEASRAAGEGVVWRRLPGFDLELSVVAAWDPRRPAPALPQLLQLLAHRPRLSHEKEPVLDTGAASRFAGHDPQIGGSDGD